MTDPVVSPLTSEDRIYEHVPPPTPTDTSTQANEARVQMIERQRARELNDLMGVLSIPEGQAFVFRVLSWTNPYSTTMGDPGAEGRRQIGLRLIDTIQRADPELYPQLLLTHLKRQREFAAAEATIAANAAKSAPKPGPFDRLARAVGLRSHAKTA